MNILGLATPTSGCGYHRILLPLGFMNDVTGLVTNLPQQEHLEKHWDILYFNRISLFDKNWQLVRETLPNTKIVIDLDDYWVLPPNHLNYYDYHLNFGAAIEKNIIEADLVTCTNERLAEKIKALNPNVHVFKNGLPFGANQFVTDKRESERVRIFWAGGASHESDIEILRQPLKKLSTYKDKIQMVIGGYTDSDPLSKKIWDRMFSVLTLGGTLPYMKLGSTMPNSYMQLYENADIMLIPLENTEWHGMKSNLKILEAACKKIPCIVSNVLPYNEDKDCPVLWVNSQKDWFLHIKDLILNPNKRIELGEQLYEWAKENYDIREINKERRQVFADLCKA